MIYTVEIPHQRPASCWTANDKDDFCIKLEQTFERYSDTPDYGASFEEWRDYLASDLYALHVFMTDDEALAALGDSVFDGHQGAKARDALRRALMVKSLWHTCGPVRAMLLSSKLERGKHERETA